MSDHERDPGPVGGTQDRSLRNRARILDVARESFSQDGTDCAITTIATRAGVGVGTVYRHFGDRVGLIRAVYNDMVDQLVNQATKLANQDPDSSPLTIWLTSYVDALEVKHAIAGELRPILLADPALLHHARLRAADALAPLLRAAQERGEVRADLDAADLLHLLDGISVPSLHRPPVQVLLDVVLRGIHLDRS